MENGDGVTAGSSFFFFFFYGGWCDLGQFYLTSRFYIIIFGLVFDCQLRNRLPHYAALHITVTALHYTGSGIIHEYARLSHHFIHIHSPAALLGKLAQLLVNADI